MKVLLLSLLPDIGHVTPLLRIGRALRQAGNTVSYVGPAETMAVAQDAALHCTNLGRVKPEDASIVSRLASASPLLTEVLLDKLAYENYFLPLTLNGLGKVGAATETVLALGPDVIIADDHLYATAYQAIATSASAPLITHRAYGTHYLPTHASGAERGAAAAARRLLKRVCGAGAARLVGLLDPAKSTAWRRNRERLASRLGELASQVREAPRPLRITTGLAVLESERFGAAPAELADVREFGPLRPLPGREATRDEDWFASRPARSVLYVSFGTMAAAVPGLFPAVISAAKELELAVYWVSASCPVAEPARLPDFVRWREWASPARVLAHPAVLAFVSHGGSGALQDAIWGGKPLICVPLMWDQSYNADLARRLAIGVRLDKARVNKAAVLSAISAVQAERVGGAVAMVQARVGELDADTSVTAWIESRITGPAGRGM